VICGKTFRKLNSLRENYGEGEKAGDSVAGDSTAAGLVVVSAGDVSLGLASGMAVSVFFSQAASRAALARMQMYFFIVVIEAPVFV
jgi:hypothetical protein